MGAGLVARRLRLRREDVYVLGGILAGVDHLASIHGEPSAEEGGRVVVAVITTDERAAELDEWLQELGEELGLEFLEEAQTSGAPP